MYGIKISKLEMTLGGSNRLLAQTCPVQKGRFGSGFVKFEAGMGMDMGVWISIWVRFGVG